MHKFTFLQASEMEDLASSLIRTRSSEQLERNERFSTSPARNFESNSTNSLSLQNKFGEFFVSCPLHFFPNFLEYLKHLNLFHFIKINRSNENNFTADQKSPPKPRRQSAPSGQRSNLPTVGWSLQPERHEDQNQFKNDNETTANGIEASRSRQEVSSNHQKMNVSTFKNAEIPLI